MEAPRCSEAAATEPEGHPQGTRNSKRKSNSSLPVSPTISKRYCKEVSSEHLRRSDRLKHKVEQQLKHQEQSSPSSSSSYSDSPRRKRKLSAGKSEAGTEPSKKEATESGHSPLLSSHKLTSSPLKRKRRSKASIQEGTSDEASGSKVVAKEESRKRTKAQSSSSGSISDTQLKGKSTSHQPSSSASGKGKGKSKKRTHSSSREGKKTEEKRTKEASLRSVYWSVIKGSSHSNMASKDKDSQPGPSGEESDGKASASGGEQGSGSSSSGTDSPMEFLGLLNDDKRLRMMLESHSLHSNLPPHLLGSLGLRMPHIFQKSMSSSNNTKAQQLMKGLQCMEDESTQLQSCIEMGQLLVMGNEDTLSGFPVKETVPSLIHLLSMEHNFDMMVHACRALTYMMEALPRSTVVVADAIPILLEKLQVIQCMDVAEQALSALEILSRRHSKSILQAGGVNACLLYLDFFSIATQRCALSVAANCCLSVSGDDFHLVADSIPVLTGRLQHQDKRSVVSCCLCFSRLVENFSSNPAVLQEIASHGLLSNIQNLLVVSPPVVSSNTFVMVVKMLSTLCGSCPILAVELLKLRFSETLKYLLVGSEEITLDNLELNTRTPNETYEIVSLISELMPPLPKTGVFKIEEILTHSRRHQGLTVVQWEWQTDSETWRPYGKVENRLIEASHINNEEDVSFDIHGRTYIVEFSEMQQINEETGTSRAVRRTTVDALIKRNQTAHQTEENKEPDPRAIALDANPDLCGRFMQALFGVLYEVFSNTAGPSVKHKCLKALLKMLVYAPSDVLTDTLQDLSVSSYLAAMLQSSDYRVVVGAIQMATTLLQKQPNVFLVQFHREGVIHAIEALKEVPLQALATPKKPEEHLKMSVPLPTSAVREEVAGGAPRSESASDSPSSARRRFVDMFRRSRRQLRKSFSRSRSEDHPTPGTPPTPIFTPLPPPPSLSTPQPASFPSEGEASTVKEQVRDWIHQQSSDFLDQWQSRVAGMNADAGLKVVNLLQRVSEKLTANGTDSLNAINELHSLLTDPTTSVSAFEFLHCNIPQKLYQLLSNGDSDNSSSIVLKHFLHTFMGLPEQGSDLSSWTPPTRPGFVLLLQKLQGCLTQLEQFPVKLHDHPNRRGSQAMKFFNSHQIKCNLERHPSASGIQSWKGGMVRIDPLATLQAVERYLLMRRPEIGRKQDDTEGSESDADDTLHHTLLTIPTKHQLEFLINDHVVPHNMTIYQAVRQFSNISGYESEEDLSMLGPPNIWIQTHTVHYRLISQSDVPVRPQRAFSLPSTPVEASAHLRLQSPGSAGSIGVRTRRQHAAMKPPLPLTSGGITSRMTRSASKEKALLPGAKPDAQTEHKVPAKRKSPLFVSIQNIKDNALSLNDPSLPVINLLRLLWALNCHWNDLYNGIPGSLIVPASEFFSSKLSAKATRQLQDPLNVMTGSFPEWLGELAMLCPFLFPFDCRQLNFYLSTFDRDRAIARLQEHQPDLSTADASERVTPKLEKKKRCVSRENILEQAEKILDEVASSRALLEVQYQDEVGTGLGPTLEFYTLVSRELQLSDLNLWWGDPCPLPGAGSGASGDSGVPMYVNSPVGLFPAPLGAGTSFSVVEEVCRHFRFLGKFMAKAIMDSRMLDIPLSEAFYQWMLGGENKFTAQDLQLVDPTVARSYSQLAAVAVKKHTLESDPLLTGKGLQLGIESLTLEGGGTIEDLDIDFTLPGYPDVELKPHGKDIPVTIHNLDEYLKLVLDWTLVTGVARQFDAFKEGFNSVFPISSLQLFYSHELDLLFCGANHQKWDVKELIEHCRPDHGYTHDSGAVQMLFRVLSTYDTAEQRQFVQFVTGSPRLPVGGFKSLNPPLTIVRKTVDSSSSSQTPDEFLPSVMTCVNYLKLPDYSSEQVMRERLNLALKEGNHSFHLS